MPNVYDVLLPKNVIFLLCLVVVALTPVNGENSLLSQQSGLYRDQPGKQLPLGKISHFEIDFDSVPLKNLKRVHIHDGLIYLLDLGRERLFVIDQQGNFIRSIGETGLGPGDLQSPSDFFISGDKKIYILCGATKWIETFDLKGSKIKRIQLNNGPFIYSSPVAVLFDGNMFYIGGVFNHLVTTFDCSGKYIDSILMRKKRLKFPGSHVVFEPQLAFTSNRDSIVVFDSFQGIFGLMDKTGNVRSLFSYKSAKQNRAAHDFRERIARSKTKAYQGAIVMPLWSSFCMDDRRNIYTIPLADGGKEGCPQLVVFSRDGRLLYKKPLTGKCFAGKSIQHISCNSEFLLVVTRDFDFIKMNWRKDKLN